MREDFPPRFVKIALLSIYFSKKTITGTLATIIGKVAYF